MSNQIVPFEFGSEQIRVVMHDGEPWFVLNDLCAVLDLSNPSKVADRIDSLNLTLSEVQNSRGQMRQTLTVNEAGMYEVVIRSDKPEAVEFRRWITGTVLPEIRRTGGYGVQRALTPDEIVAQALQITTAKVKELEAEVEQARPAVEYVERFVGQSSDAVTVDVFASQFGTTGPRVRELLMEKHVAVRKCVGERWSQSKQRMEKEYEWRPRQGVRSSDWFDLRPQHNAPRLHNGQVKQTMYVRQFHAHELAIRLGLVDIDMEGIAA